MPQNNRIRKWLNNKLNDYWWGGAISFYNEIYICMSFGALINLYSDMRFNGPAAVAFNNFYALVFTALLLFGPILFVAFLYKSLRVKAKEIDDELEKLK